MSTARDEFWAGLTRRDALDLILDEPPQFKGGFAESTIEAAVWIICFEPDRLKLWLERHPPGDKLEAIARQRIAHARVKRGDG